MAFIEVFWGCRGAGFVGSPKRGSGSTWHYNVSMAVGPGAPNANEDVTLVQTMLAKVHLFPGFRPDLLVDGRFGQETHTQILAFQKFYKSMGLPISTDGRVDRAQGAVGLVSHTIYTIFLLNQLLHGSHPEYYPDLDTEKHTSMPPVLW